ncbi:serine/threonine protein kinase [Aromatoleum petrolei]|uniref:Protein kinase n=1 Tax=Aromatoleum petrolei TaxID=76116 RepID=A0ABX1MSH2_9RHOO|nr:serine/threonine protein kinase [Aromatoleum petrolei]NMF90922.1 protein kinase [Aromatoleum petrolei]QTQ35097.1 Serine/threonine protein kinase [Aromatoleum petrolei]
MASLSHAIHAFQAGGLSSNEFFAQVDHALKAEKTDYTQLLEVLSEENTKYPLPPDVYAEVHRRIEHLAAPEQNKGAATSADQTRMLINPADMFPPADAASPAPPDAEPERVKGVGETIKGRFRLEECIGFGGMGTVYKALDLRKLEASDRNPYIAIKILNVQFRGHPKSLIALQREAKKAQTLAHPNIVTVYDFDRDGSMVYLTMEYLAGQPLSRMLHAPDFRGLPYADALRIFTGMANALSYAHERGFVHCDFKPANVFLTDNGQVKIIDFGIARVFRRSEEEVEATIFDAGSLGGLTPAYASPEILEHLEPDPRDDVYALACITYELLTGTHPFGRLPATQARNANLRPQRPKGLPAMQWRALRNALSFDRASRTPSVAQFLQGMKGEHRLTVPLALGVAGLATAALVAVTVIWYWEPSDTPASPQGSDEPPAAPAPTAEAAPPLPAPTPAPTPVPVAPPPAPALSLAAVTPVLAQVPCSALTASVSGDALQVRGYVPERFGVARLTEALNAIPGVKTLKADVQQLSDDKCNVIAALSSHWNRNWQAGHPASIRMRGAVAELTEGDALIVDVTTPAYESYVHVDYHVLDGSVAHLVPSRRARANQAPPNHSATIGTLAGWTISKPFGTELITLLVTPVPIFEGLRPEFESRAEYLRALEQRLREIAAKHGTDRIVADFVQITTRARER